MSERGDTSVQSYENLSHVTGMKYHIANYNTPITHPTLHCHTIPDRLAKAVNHRETSQCEQILSLWSLQCRYLLALVISLAGWAECCLSFDDSSLQAAQKKTQSSTVVFLLIICEQCVRNNYELVKSESGHAGEWLSSTPFLQIPPYLLTVPTPSFSPEHCNPFSETNPLSDCAAVW